MGPTLEATGTRHSSFSRWQLRCSDPQSLPAPDHGESPMRPRSIAVGGLHESANRSADSGRARPGPHRVRSAHRNHHGGSDHVHQPDRLEGQRLLRQLEQQPPLGEAPSEATFDEKNRPRVSRTQRAARLVRSLGPVRTVGDVRCSGMDRVVDRDRRCSSADSSDSMRVVPTIG